MPDLDCKQENLVEEQTELLRHIEIEDKRDNIELLKSKLAKLRIKDNKNTDLMDERESTNPQSPRGLQNKRSARAEDTATVSRQSGIPLQELCSTEHLKRAAQQEMRVFYSRLIVRRRRFDNRERR